MRNTHILIFTAALAFSATVRAEAALADLIIMMPGIILKGVYSELARPWLLAGLWGAAALFWLVRAITGRDAIGQLLDVFAQPSRPWLKTTSYGGMALLASATLLYVLVGYADRPSLTQVIAQAATLAAIVGLGRLVQRRSRPAPRTPVASAA